MTTGDEPHAEDGSIKADGSSASTGEDGEVQTKAGTTLNTTDGAGTEASATEDTETTTDDPETESTESDTSESEGTETGDAQSTGDSTTDSGTDTESTTTTGADTDAESSTATGTDTGDDPLPSQLVLGESVLTEIINESAFDTSLRRCPMGHVAVAASGQLGSESWLGKMQLHCAAISLSGLVNPAIVVGGTTLLGVQGSQSANDGAWGLSCPPGKFIQGLVVHTDSSAVFRVYADCIRLAWALDPANGTVTGELVAEGRERVEDNLNNTDSSGSGSVSCPLGHVATGLVAQHGIFISGLGLECRPWSTNR